MARIKTHPGEILKEEFMLPLGLSANRLGAMLSVPHNRVSDLVRGRRGMTADTAPRLAKCFGTTPEFWMNLQSAHDLSRASTESGKEIERRVEQAEGKAA